MTSLRKDTNQANQANEDRASMPLFSWHVNEAHPQSCSVQSALFLEVSLACNPGWPESHNPLALASVSPVLELQVCIAPGLSRVLYCGFTVQAWLIKSNRLSDYRTIANVFLVTSFHTKAISRGCHEPSHEHNKDTFLLLRTSKGLRYSLLEARVKSKTNSSLHQSSSIEF